MALHPDLVAARDAASNLAGISGDTAVLVIGRDFVDEAVERYGDDLANIDLDVYVASEDDPMPGLTVTEARDLAEGDELRWPAGEVRR